MKKATLICIVFSMLICFAANSAEDAPRADLPAAGPEPRESEPTQKFDYTNRRIISDLDATEFSELYANRGKPRFLVLVNRELSEGNPAEWRMIDLVQRRVESIGGARGTSRDTDISGDDNVVVNIGGNRPDNRDTQTTVSRRGRDKTDLEIINDQRVESSVIKILHKYKVDTRDIDGVRLAVERAAARTEEGAGDETSAEMMKLEEFADVLVMVKDRFDVNGILGYSIKVTRLADGRILFMESKARVTDRYGQPFTLEGYEKFFEQRTRRMLRDISDFWKETNEIQVHLVGFADAAAADKFLSALRNVPGVKTALSDDYMLREGEGGILKTRVEYDGSFEDLRQEITEGLAEFGVSSQSSSYERLVFSVKP
jgi:hypothetical protein